MDVEKDRRLSINLKRLNQEDLRNITGAGFGAHKRTKNSGKMHNVIQFFKKRSNQTQTFHIL